MTLKKLMESLSPEDKEQFVIEELTNLPAESRRRVCQKLEFIDMHEMDAWDVSQVLEIFVQRRQMVKCRGILREEIRYYLHSVASEERREDLQLFLERSLDLLDSTLTIRKLKALAIQIKGQLTFDGDAKRLADSWYWSFRKNPPHQLLNACQAILRL